MGSKHWESALFNLQCVYKLYTYFKCNFSPPIHVIAQGIRLYLALLMPKDML